MTRMKRTHIAAGTLALALAPAAAAACSPGADYRVPSNLELAGQAETIVLARVVAGELDEEDPAEGTVTIHPLEAIKGPLPQGDIALKGMMLAEHVGDGSDALSNPYEFQRAHPVSYWGACIRYVFPLGTTALFFLRTDHEGMWAPAGDAFSRWAEDVADANAPWVQLARLYTIAAALPEEDRAPFLEDEREALLARTGEPLARLMAGDIARQLAAPDAPQADTLENAFREPGEESAVEAVLKAMRQGAGEAGN
jgi:hypothetical protein